MDDMASIISMHDNVTRTLTGLQQAMRVTSAQFTGQFTIMVHDSERRHSLVGVTDTVIVISENGFYYDHSKVLCKSALASIADTADYSCGHT